MAQYQVNDIVVVYLPISDRTINTRILTILEDVGSDDEEVSVYEVLDSPNGLIEITDDDIVELVSGPTLNDRRRQRDLSFFGNPRNEEVTTVATTSTLQGELSSVNWSIPPSLPSQVFENLARLPIDSQTIQPLTDEQFIAPVAEIVDRVRTTQEIINENPALNIFEFGIGFTEARRRRAEIERIISIEQENLDNRRERESQDAVLSFERRSITSEGIYQQILQSPGRVRRINMPSEDVINYFGTNISPTPTRIPPPTPILPPVINLESIMTGPEQNARLNPISQADYNPLISSQRVVSFPILNKHHFSRGVRPQRGVTICLTPILRRDDNDIIWIDNDGFRYLNSIQNRDVDRIQDPEGVLTYFDNVRITWAKQSTLIHQLGRGMIGVPGKKAGTLRKKLKHKYGKMPVIKSEDNYAGKNFIA